MLPYQQPDPSERGCKILTAILWGLVAIVLVPFLLMFSNMPAWFLVVIVAYAVVAIRVSWKIAEEEK